MVVQVQIVDGGGRGSIAQVSPAGLILLSAPDDESAFKELAVDDTVYNFFAPKFQNAFIITSFLAFADKSVSDTSDTVIVIYEASSETGATVDKTLFQFGMGKLTVLPIGPLRLKVSEGKFLNAKTGDNSIHLTIVGHYEAA